VHAPVAATAGSSILSPAAVAQSVLIASTQYQQQQQILPAAGYPQLPTQVHQMPRILYQPLTAQQLQQLTPQQQQVYHIQMQQQAQHLQVHRQHLANQVIHTSSPGSFDKDY